MLGTTYEKPIPTNASKLSISSFAEDVGQSLGLGFGDPIEPVVASLGGAISFRAPIGVDRHDSIVIEPSGQFRIFLSSMTSSRRDRFTLAHELGHFFLHFPLVRQLHPHAGMRATRWVDDTNPDLQRCEWEANWFAAALLMPESEFRSIYSAGGIDSAQAKFEVSEQAASVRARSLGLQ